MKLLSFEFCLPSGVYATYRKFQPLHFSYSGSHASKHRHRHVESGMYPKSAKNTTHRNYKSICTMLLRAFRILRDTEIGSIASRSPRENVTHSMVDSSTSADSEDPEIDDRLSP